MRTHQISAGETLSSIAARYGTTVDALAAANGIQNKNLIIAGASLSVPDRFDGGAPQGGGPGSQRTTSGDSFAATRGPVYDGRTPAPGTTNTNAAYPASPPVRGNPRQRNPATYDNVINQFAVANNPRYAQRNGNTYCNIFAWDVMSAMGVTLPHWVYRNGAPAEYAAPGAYELDANGGHRWLNQHGSAHGWRQVGAAEAQRLANAGHPTVVSYDSGNSTPGHIAVVRPGQINDRGPVIAQAGAVNINYSRVADRFGTVPVQYWVNDRGTPVNNPGPRPPGGGTPTTPQPQPVPGGVPQANLVFDGGRRYRPEVEQLQRALVEAGYMTRADMNTGPGYYGPRTKAAVAKLQARYGIADDGTHFGPQTRAALTRALSGAGGGGGPAGVPQENLVYSGGTRHEPAVERLQRALIQAGFMTDAQFRTGPGYYGPLTRSAVAKLQAKHGIADDGTHYGPLTRAALIRELQS